MKLGLRGRLFLVSVALLFAAGSTSAVYLESELRGWLQNRIEDELLVSASATIAAIELADEVTDLKGFDELTDRLGLHLGKRVSLIEATGRVIGDSALSLAQVREVENHLNRPEVMAALRTGEGTARRMSATLGSRTLYVAVPFTHPNARGVVRVATPLASIDEAVARLHIFILLATCIGLALAIIVSLLTSHLLALRIRRMVTSQDTDSDGVLRSPEGHGSEDELTVRHHSLSRFGDTPEEIVAARASERDRFAAVLDGMKEAVIAVDGQRRVSLVNPAALEFLELRTVELGAPLDSLISSPEILQAFETAIGGQGTELDIIARDGTRHVLCRAAPSGSVPGCIMVLHDVTRLRRLERMRRDFVANVSHELRTPVSVIRINAEALADGAMSDPHRGPHFVSALLRNAERLSDLISDLLDISRIESGLYEMEPNVISVSEAIPNALDSIGELAKKKGIKVTVGGVDGLEVNVDRRALDHVLINLLQNAVRYTQEGGHVHVNSMISAGLARIEVRDNGPGIPDKYHGRIFERFFRVDKGRSTHMGGTGLGLSIVKHLVGNMGGDVGVSNNPPQGALFWVTLPAEQTKIQESLLLDEDATIG